MTVSEFSFCVRHGITAALFDWDGVVLDSGADYYRSYELALAEVGVTTKPAEVYLREGMTTDRVMAAILAEHGRNPDPSLVTRLVERRRDLYMGIARHQLFPGIEDLLQQLRQCNIKLGLVTGSSRRTLDLALTPQQQAYFDAIVTGDSVRCPKPDPEPFLVTLKRLQVNADEALVIENAPFGIESAHRAGCRAVAICTTVSATDLAAADWIIQDHHELRTLLMN